MKRFRWIALVAAAVGCKAVPAMHYYMLEPRAQPIAPAGDGLEVGVLPFSVDQPYDQDRIVYRVGADSPQVGFYEYHRWAAPLSHMLPRLVCAAYGDLEGVGRIEPAASDRRYDVRLTGRVVALEEVDTDAGQHVRLDLTLTLVGADGSTLWSTTASGRGDASADTVEGIAVQARDVVESVLASRREAIARVLLSAPASE